MNLNKKIVTGICAAIAVAVVGLSGCGSLTGSQSGQSSSGQSSSGQPADDTMTLSDAAFLDVAEAEAEDAGDSAAPGERHGRFRHPLRARHFFRGLHGEATVRTKDGFKQIAWQRGQVTAVSGNRLTVRSADGATWQWIGGNNSKIRKQGDKASLSQLATNDRVLVIGTLDGSTRTIRAAVVPKRVPRNTATPSPSAS